MTATRRTKNIVAATPSGDVTTDMILGYIALVSIPNQPVSATKLRRLWMAEGLDESLVPKQRRPADVFMAACRSIESRRSPHRDPDTFSEVKVDRVLESSEECIYQVTQLVRDKDNRVIDHPKAMRLTFTAKDGKITDEPLDDKKLYKELSQLADAVRFEFDKNGTKVPGNKVRAAIRETLLADHSTRIQNKGVFFVPKAARPTLDSIQDVLDSLYKGTGLAELVVLPCLADAPEKEMITRHYTENVTSEIDGLIAECSARLKSETPVRGDRQKNLVADRLRIKGGIERYENMLDTKMLVLNEKVNILDDALEQLLMPKA